MVLDSNVLDAPRRQCPGLRGRPDRRGQPTAPNNSTSDPLSPSLQSHSAFQSLPEHQGAEPTVPVETVLAATRSVVLAVQTEYDYPSRHWQKSRSSGILPVAVAVADSEGTVEVVVEVVVVHADFLLQMMCQGAGRTLQTVDVALKTVRGWGCSVGIVEVVVVVVGDSGHPGAVDWCLVDTGREVAVAEVAIDPLVVGDHPVVVVGRLVVDGTLPYAASVADAAATSVVAEEWVVVLPDGIPVETLPEVVLPVVAFPDTVVPGTSVPVLPVVAASFAAVAAVVAATPAFVAAAEPAPVAAAPTEPPAPPPPSASSSASSSFSVAPRLPYPAVVAEESVVAVVAEEASDGTVDLLVPGVPGTMVSSA